MTAGLAPTTELFTFLFTDIEGSTRLWASDPTAMSASLRLHDDLMREVIESHGGHIFTTAGDAFCVAFTDTETAVTCARDAQAGLASAAWPGPELKVRMGLHVGEAETRDGDYFGPEVNTAARVGDAGHGGQVVLSEEVRLVTTDLPTIDLGTHRLRDVPEPVHLHQIGTAVHPALRVMPDALSSLPTPATSFIGRSEEVLDARSLLLDHRLITITGPGGSGKTRLAIEVAKHEIAHFRHGAYFADLSTVTGDDEVVGAIADAVRFHLSAGDPTTQVLDYLDGKQLLLVLDNCEHLVDVCADFAESALARDAEWRLVTTSREHLGVEGEHVVQVRALAAADDGPAVELFVDRATAVKPTYVVDDSNREFVAELCERLDGLPLAIELAAARVVVMSAAEMLDRMDDRLRLLSGGRGRTRQRHRTLEATLDWSYDLLEPDEQRFFDALGVMAGPFAPGLAAAVAEIDALDVLEMLESLVAKSLVSSTVTNDRTTFHLLESMRAYAHNRLDRAGGELEHCRNRHLQFHVDAIAQTVAETGSWVVWDWETVKRLLPLLSNLEAAIDWAIAVGRHDLAAELLVAGTPLWREQLAVQRILDRVDAVIEAGLDTDLRERLLVLEIQLALTVNDWPRAMPFLDGSLAVDNEIAREFRLLMGANRTSMTDPERSLALAEEAAEIGNDAFSFWDKNQADVHLFAGEYQAALDVLLPHQGRNLWSVIDGTIAIAYLMDGRPAEALAVAKDHPMSDSIRMSFGVIVGLSYLALGETDAGRRELLAEARTAALGRMSLIANSALVGLAGLAHHEGDEEWAKEIILGARCQREVAINALARMVAEQIGVGAEFVEQQEAAFADSGANDRTEFLRETLARFTQR